MKGIKLIILFGSKASGKSGRLSDTDVAVLADHPLCLEEKSELSLQVAEKLGVSEDDIDIVDLADASPLLAQEISSKGKLLRGDEEEFVRFRVRAWKRYLDTARFRRAREKALEKSIHV